jgi:hypothetical protein
MARDCTAEIKEKAKKTKRTPPTCYNCHIRGHVARDSTVKAVQPVQKTKRSAPNCYSCNEEGLRTCDREVRKGELTRTDLVI